MTTVLANAPVARPRLPDLSPADRERVALPPRLDPPGVAGASARQSLREQIARLESQLPPGLGSSRRDRGARLLSVDELERVRDDLVRRTQERRFTGGEEQDRKRRLREEMLLDPAAHFGTTVSNAEVGEPGCTRWACWFRLRISGGCP